MNEAEITINGTKITQAMSMTIRVALNAFAMELSQNGLGDSGNGKAITKAYLARIREISSLMYAD